MSTAAAGGDRGRVPAGGLWGLPGGAHPAPQLPAHATDATQVMTPGDYAVLCEILSRAESVLHSSPSPDRSLSFLRVLAAYDQILLRHDMAPSQDTALFHWLVTLNIETEADMRQAAAEGATLAPGIPHAKEYAHWKAKLDQLYAAGQQAQEADAQQTRQTRAEAPVSERRRDRSPRVPASVRLHDQELSLDSLSSSSLATSPRFSPHVSFAAPHSHRSRNRNRSRSPPTHSPPQSSRRREQLADPKSSSSRSRSTSRSGRGTADEKRRNSRQQTGVVSGDDSSGPEGAEARDEQVFLDLLRASSRKSHVTPSPTFAAPGPQRQRLMLHFRAWRTHCRPRFELMPRMRAARRAHTQQHARNLLSHWRARTADAHYLRELEARALLFERRHGGSLLHQLFRYWLQSSARRHHFKSKQRLTYAGVAFQTWRLWLRRRAYQHHLQRQAERHKRSRDRHVVIHYWVRFVRRQRRVRKQIDGMQLRRCHVDLSDLWAEWRRRFTAARQHVRVCGAHLLRLRQHQSVRHWVTSTRLLHSPSHRSVLSVQQFHVLWRWMQCAFGNGYDLLAIIWLTKFKFDPSSSSSSSMDQAPRRRPAQSFEQQHPTSASPLFVSGPPVHSSFAMTMASGAPSFADSQLQQGAAEFEFAQSVPAVTFHPSVGSGGGGSSSGSTDAPVLGSPASSLGVGLGPRVDANLPLVHAILDRLNRSCLFRRHKLPQLLSMIQLWARWYAKHLFAHWRSNVALKKAQRAAQQKAQALVVRAEREQEAQAIRVHSQGLLLRAMERWHDSYSKATYYSLLLRGFYARQTRRLLSAHYIHWKFNYVSSSARTLFRLRRGVRNWRRHLSAERGASRKCAIVQYRRHHNVLSMAWSAWRLTLRRERDARYTMTAILWQRWKDTFVLQAKRRQEDRDAATYYALKLLLRSLLTWRGASIRVSIEGQLTQRAVHQHHQTLSHRHIVWWVNWRRYKADSRRMLAHGDEWHARRLSTAAVSLWLTNVRASRTRHHQLRSCRVFVRNKHLALQVLRRWRYSLEFLRRTRRIQGLVAHNAQVASWLRWLEAVRSKNAQYERLEVAVMLRRDYNALGAQFHRWLTLSRDIARSRRLKAHCETAWYFALVKRLFRSWRFVARDVHAQQMVQAAHFHQEQGVAFRALRCLRQWRGILQHKARYASFVRETNRRLQKRFHMREWFRQWQDAFTTHKRARIFRHRRHAHTVIATHWQQWRELFAESRQAGDKIAVVVRLTRAHTLRQLFQRWAGPFTALSRRRRAALAAVTHMLGRSRLREALHEWKQFRVGARLQSLAQSFDRRRQLSRVYSEWKSLFTGQRRDAHDQFAAIRMHTRHTVQRVYRAWKASCRATHIHNLFLERKTLLSWRRYTQQQHENARVAVSFRDGFETRRLRFVFALWRRFIVHFCRKQRRRLGDRRRRAQARGVKDALALWSGWSQARTQAREHIALVAANVLARRQARGFAHWSLLYQQLLWVRELDAFATRTHQRKATQRALQSWLGRTNRFAHRRALRRQAGAFRTNSLLTGTLGAWMQLYQQRAKQLVALQRHFSQPRLERIYRRWRAVTGRRSRILRLHRPHLQRVLREWLEHAREQRCSSVWEPAADEHYRRALATSVLWHWRRFRGVHNAFMQVRPLTEQRLCRAALNHWQGMLELQQRRHDFHQRVLDQRAARQQRSALRQWWRRVAQRHARVNTGEAVRVVAARHLKLRCYIAWRTSLHVHRSLHSRSIAFLHSRPLMRLKRLVLGHWHARLRFQRTGQALDSRAQVYHRQVTQPRFAQAAFQKWHQLARYSTHIDTSRSSLLARRETRTWRKLFGAWLYLSRRRVALRCMERAKRLYAGRDAVRAWRHEAAILKRFDVLSRNTALSTQHAALAQWWSYFKLAQRERAEVQLLQSRMRLASHRGKRGWVRARHLLVPILKTWMGAGSSLRFYMQVWRAYNRQCRSFHDAHDAAQKHYEQRVLTPAAWREWQRAHIISVTGRQADAFRLRAAQGYFIARLQQLQALRTMRSQQVQLADVHRQEASVSGSFTHWRDETVARQQQRAAYVHDLKVRAFDVWQERVEFRRLSNQRRAQAEQFNVQRLARANFSHWKAVWLYTLSLSHAGRAFGDKLHLWHLGRLFGAWLDRYRRAQWRRQRAALILQAVRSLWQKNAFMAWQHYVLAVRTQRKEFVLARVLYAWKLLAKRERARRREAADDEERLEQLEMERQQTRPTRMLASPLRRSLVDKPAQPRGTFADSASSSFGSRGVALSSADLDDGVGSGAVIDPIASVLVSNSPLPGPSLSIFRTSSSGALSARGSVRRDEEAAASSSSSPLSPQWRLTPFRGAASAAAPPVGTISPTAYALSGSAYGRRHNTGQRGDIASLLPPSPSSLSPAALQRSMRATVTTRSPPPAMITPERKGRDQLSPQPSLLSQSSSKKRQEERAAEHARREQERLLSPATAAFVKKLFVN